LSPFDAAERAKLSGNLHGIPSNTVDLEAFERFIFACGIGSAVQRCTILARWKDRCEYDLINRLSSVLRHSFMRETTAHVEKPFPFGDWEPDAGPGRTDTFHPGKDAFGISLGKTGNARAGWSLRFAIDLAARPAQREKHSRALGRQ